MLDVASYLPILGFHLAIDGDDSVYGILQVLTVINAKEDNPEVT
jgi:hypothetical protein